MKSILVFFTLIIAFSGIKAQENVVQQEMDYFTKELKIKKEQRAALSQIIIRKQEQLEAIASLRANDENHYRAKRRNIVIGAERSIKQMLNKDQLPHWHEYKSKTRIANAKRIKDLRANDASKQDLLDAQAGIVN